MKIQAYIQELGKIMPYAPAKTTRTFFPVVTLGDEPTMPPRVAPLALLFEPFRASWRAGVHTRVALLSEATEVTTGKKVREKKK